MVEQVKTFLLSHDFWFATAYLLLGAIIGALVSNWYTLKARRPKLIVAGGGGGGNADKHSWQITLSNRPAFLGIPLDGETAHDVQAHIRTVERRSQAYLLFWNNTDSVRVSISPGSSASLRLFHWFKEEDGYNVVDQNGEAVARFTDRSREFEITIFDRLSRRTRFKFHVEFDDTHLKNTPRLSIVHPVSFAERLQNLRKGFRQIGNAFRSR